MCFITYPEICPFKCCNYFKSGNNSDSPCIKTDIDEIQREGVDWIHLSQNSVVSTEINIRIA
jgi:hypothetical protein